ncbi:MULTISPECIES: hypothetical protein [unclassified Mesorhizobium]|uniref:hypothetical protein n=1 Tax=unclassified Mesorhizobium TaxID=325217 RepID=UPI0012EC7238|nr:hypothetical protein [Mesorhizobium sp. LSJC268A00]
MQYLGSNDFDWLAIVILADDGANKRTIYIVPRAEVDRQAQRNAPTTKTADVRYLTNCQLERRFGSYRDNFELKTLSLAPVPSPMPA